MTTALWFLVNVTLTALVVSSSSLLARKVPGLAGLVVTLPMSTMLVLLLSRFQHGAAVDTSKLATSILVALPVSSLFIVPFALADRLHLPFAWCWPIGLALLAVGWLVHRALLG